MSLLRNPAYSNLAPRAMGTAPRPTVGDQNLSDDEEDHPIRPLRGRSRRTVDRTGPPRAVVHDDEKDGTEEQKEYETGASRLADAAEAPALTLSKHDLPINLQSPQIGRYWRQLLQKIVDIGRNLHRPLNIALIGRPGTGKTSFINTILSTFSTDVNPGMHRTVLPDSDHVTQASSLDTIPGTRINLVDLFGFTMADDGAEQRILGPVLRGYRDLSSIRREELQPDRPPPAMDPNPDHVIASVIFFADINEDLGATKVTEVMDVFRSAGRQPVVALSKIDNLVYQREYKDFNPSFAYDYTSVQKAMTAASQTLSVDLNSMFPCTFYTNENARDKRIELMSLVALYEAVMRGWRRLMLSGDA